MSIFYHNKISPEPESPRKPARRRRARPPLTARQIDLERQREALRAERLDRYERIALLALFLVAGLAAVAGGILGHPIVAASGGTTGALSGLKSELLRRGRRDRTASFPRAPSPA
jgi:hypothetical protein